MPTPQPQQVRAIIATAIVVFALAIVAGASYWYGRNNPANTNTAATNTTVATTDGTNAGQAQAKETTIVGTVKQVLGDSIELTTGTGETSKTVTAMITSATSIRKLDYRNVPKQGLGDGVTITKGELKTGATVVVRTTDATSAQIQASKVSLLIYR